MRLVKILLFVCAYLVGALPHCFAQPGQGLLISPLNQTLQGRPGAKGATEFIITNRLKARMVIDVTLQDITQDMSGAPVLSEAGSTPRSAAKWISVQQGTSSLSTGQQKVIRANVIIPSNVTGSYHAAIVVRLLGDTIPEAAQSSASVVNQAVLPIHIFITGTQKPQIELQSAELKPALGNFASMLSEAMLEGKWILVPMVRNTGNSMVRLKGDIVVTSLRGELIGRYQVNDGDPDGQAVLPGSTVAFPLFINSLLPDEQYPARVSLKFQGAKRIEGYSAPMTLKPHVGGNAQKGEVALGTVDRTGLQALVEPRVVIGNVQPSSVKTQRITVTNLEDFPVSVMASSSGLAIDVDGEVIPLPDTAASQWMVTAPASFRLGPRQSRVVSVRMTAPGDQTDRWGLLQFVMTSANPATSTLTTTARTTVLLRNAANPTNGDAKGQTVTLTRTGNKQTLSITVANTQNRPLAFTTSAVLLLPPAPAPSKEAKDEEQTTPNPIVLAGERDIVLLPNTTRRLDFDLPENITPGQYAGTMKLGGLAASGGATATSDFSIQFKLNLAGAQPAPAKPLTPATGNPNKPKTPASKPKVPATKPRPTPTNSTSKVPAKVNPKPQQKPKPSATKK